MIFRHGHLQIARVTVIVHQDHLRLAAAPGFYDVSTELRPRLEYDIGVTMVLDLENLFAVLNPELVWINAQRDQRLQNFSR